MKDNKNDQKVNGDMPSPGSGQTAPPELPPDEGTPGGAAPESPAEAPDQLPAPRRRNPVFLALSVVLSVGGVAGFLYLFLRDFNIYWLILSPVILALYQIPAVFVYWLYKKGRPVR